MRPGGAICAQSVPRHFGGMTNSEPLPPVLTLPAQRPLLRAFGEEVQLHLTGEDTGGRYAMWTETTPPGGGPPPHVHALEDEWFHVLEGRVAFFAGGSWTEVPPGASAFMPRNVPHTFKNVGDRPLRMLIQTAPAGFEVFFGRCAAEFARPEGPDMARVIQISAEHGIRFL